MAMPAHVRRQPATALRSERPLLVFDFEGRPVRSRPTPTPATVQPQSIREAVLAWLDEKL